MSFCKLKKKTILLKINVLTALSMHISFHQNKYLSVTLALCSNQQLGPRTSGMRCIGILTAVFQLSPPEFRSWWRLSVSNCLKFGQTLKFSINCKIVKRFGLCTYASVAWVPRANHQGIIRPCVNLWPPGALRLEMQGIRCSCWQLQLTTWHPAKCLAHWATGNLWILLGVEELVMELVMGKISCLIRIWGCSPLF